MAGESAPPYLRIVAEIRRRIAAGELAPGDRVPSVRGIAREWRVAQATATKALAVLRNEGLVTARPRSGTVVAERAPKGGGAGEDVPEGELTVGRLVRAATALADAEGMGALSMRAVAARLGVAPMTAYRYVSGKRDLVLRMVDSVLAEVALPAVPPARWRARTEAGARALWALHRAHPWLAQTGPLTRPLVVPGLIAYSDWVLRGLEAAGLAAKDRFDLNILLYSHIQALALHLEREAQAAGATGVSDQEWMDAEEPRLARLLATGAYPSFAGTLAAMAGPGYDLLLDDLFELGLRTLLDGVERRTPEPGAPYAG